jgi:hypothetical protein
MMAIILVILCLLGIYHEMKSVKACFEAEVPRAAMEQLFNLLLFVLLIFYIYASKVEIHIKF